MDKDRKLMKFYFLGDDEVGLHYHQNIELFYVMSGELVVDIDDKSYHIKKGDIILINANKEHLVKGINLLGARFEIDFHLLAEHMGSMRLLFWCNSVVDKNAAYAELRSLLDQILKRYFEQDDQAALYLNALYFQALYVLTSNFLVKASDARLNIGDSNDRIRVMEIQNYVQANYQSKISLNDLAKRLYLSNAYLSKYIKRQTGMTFMEYLNNVRFFHAIDELLYSDKNITDIALDSGFPSSAAFGKAFRKVYGEAPSEYRKKIEDTQKQEKQKKDLTDEELKQMQKYLHLKEEEEAREADQKQCYVDIMKEAGELNAGFRAICIGEAYHILQSDVQMQLKDIQSAIGIKYVRIWNILSKKECFVSKEGHSFRKMDQVIDFLLENHMKPYMELGEKETAFMYSPDRFLKAGEDNSHYNWEMFQIIIPEFCMHLVNRYGVEEIETWYFEYWKNPEQDMISEEGNYYACFELIYRTLKGISSNIRVGGAGFILGYEYSSCKKIFETWKTRSAQPDFLSFYSYQYVAMEGDGQFYGRKSIDTSYMTNQLELMKEIMDQLGFQVPEIHFSEWNFTISNRNLLNDSCEQGAYVLKSCMEMNGNLDMMIYWHALDSYSDYFDSDKVLNGDSGIISRDGIHKPSFYAFRFMNKLKQKVLYQDEHSIVTADGGGRYVIACHNYKKLSSQYVFQDEDQIQFNELDNYTENSECLKLSIVLDSIPNGKYLIKTQYVNKEYGSAQDLWRHLLFETNLDWDELQYLKQNAIPKIDMYHSNVTDEKLELENTLMAQEIRLIEIQYYYTT